METNHSDLACFVPDFIKSRLRENSAWRKGFVAESFEAAILFADISGFTPLANRLAEHGPEGAEELNRILDACYGELVNLIYDHGGDVVAFAGDALFAIWPAAESATMAVTLASQCALSIQEQLRNSQVVADARLSMRVSVAAGDLLAAQVGGVADYWQLVVLGRPLDQLRLADKLARVGDVVLSPEATSLATEVIGGEPIADRHFRLSGIRNPGAATEAPVLVAAADQQSLRRYVPQVVLSRYDAGHSGWLAELRRVTVMFLNIKGVQTRTAEEMSQLQTVMQVLQKVIQRYEGTIVQLIADDKGTVSVICFGLPPFTHEDDAIRAIYAAADIQNELIREGFQADCGITHGRIFCGPRGSRRRREYTVTGDVVNLAARLMQHSQADILCDEATYDATGGKVSCEKLPAFRLKGFPELVNVFRPRVATSSQESAPRMVGRRQQLEQLLESLTSLREGQRQTVLLEGEAGIGKSLLVEQLLEEAAAGGVRAVVGECSSIERQTAYFPWRSVFAHLLRLEGTEIISERRTAVVSQISVPPELADMISLLNVVLEVEFPENELVKQLSGRARSENLHRLLTLIVNEAAQRKPLLIVLEDVHWQDSASWELAHSLCQHGGQVMLVLVLRPLLRTEQAYQEILASPETRRISLDLLSEAETLDLVPRLVGVARLSAGLAEYVCHQSQGNPFFADELIKFLRDAEQIHVADGCCQLKQADQPERLSRLPATIRDVVTSRIDQLTLPQQLTLKTASVIGRSFAHRILKEVYPVAADKGQLDDNLHLLVTQDLTRLEADEPELRSIFKHVTIQQTAYDQLPVAQRRPLHRAIARWYETTFPETSAHYPLLAYHWGKAEDPDKETYYLAKSGEESLRQGANREAVNFFELVLQCHADACSDVDSLAERARRGHWLRQLGEAYFQLGDLPHSRTQLEHAVEELGHPIPGKAWKVVASIVQQLLVQFGHRLRRSRAGRSADDDQHSVAMEAALADQRLAQIHYFSNELVLGTYCNLRSLNCAENVGDSPALARSYANMCIVMGVVRWHSMAASYARLAESTARRTHHLPALAYVLNVCSMYYLGIGGWDKVQAYAAESIQISQRLADLRLAAESVTVQAMLHCFVAEFEKGHESFERVLEIGRQSGNEIHQAWGWCGRGECLFRLGRSQEAVEALEKAVRLLEGKSDRTEEVRALGLLAVANWQTQQAERGVEYAERTVALVAEVAHTTASTLEGFAGAAEVLLANWEQDPDSPEARSAALAATDHMRTYARGYRIGRPRALRLQGLVHWHSGRRGRAARCWRRSQELAHELGMVMEAELAEHELTSRR